VSTKANGVGGIFRLLIADFILVELVLETLGIQDSRHCFLTEAARLEEKVLECLGLRQDDLQGVPVGGRVTIRNLSRRLFCTIKK